MNSGFKPVDPQRFKKAIERFDEENARDPNCVTVNGKTLPRELAYAEWLSDWVLKLRPQASEALRLAARSQHICRWTVPRESYPMTRPGYLKWREDLKKFHAQKAGEILTGLGYDPELVSRVQRLNLKKDFPSDPEARVLEDALCLVFLERQLSELAEKTSDEKLSNALQKSWKKMTPVAREHALKLEYTPAVKAVLEKALAGAT